MADGAPAGTTLQALYSALQRARHALPVAVAMTAGTVAVAVTRPVPVAEQAVGVTSDPLLSNGRYPRQAEYEEAQVALLADGAERQVLYSTAHFSAQAAPPVGTGAAVALPVADAEQAVGVTSDPLLSNGRYPRHEEYSAAQVALLADGWPRQVLYAVAHLAAQASGVAVWAKTEVAAAARKRMEACILNMFILKNYLKESR